MPNKQILNYIEANIAAHTKESLSKALVQGGWPAADVAAAFLEFERPKQVAPDAIVVETAPSGLTTTVVTPQQNVPEQKSGRPEGGDPRTFAKEASAQALPEAGAPMDAGAAMLAEMQKHRKEAEAMNPNITVGGPAPLYIPQQQTSGASGIIGILIRTGLVKTEAGANAVMIVFVVLVLGITGWLLWGSI